MTLQDVYDQLSYGELSQLFAASAGIDDVEGAMPSSSYPKILPSIQLGLTELHKRFFLREGQFYLELQPFTRAYLLSNKFAESNSRSTADKYILDTDEPFSDNLFKVERLLGTYREEVYEIAMNERGDPSSLMTSRYDRLIVPTDPELAPWLKETTQIDVRYRADHPAINTALANAAPSTIEIELPPTHLEALLFYIASRLHNPLGMTPETTHEGNNYFQRFLASCEELKMQNYEIDEGDDNTKLWERGFC